jgi:predicted transcriptional regulator
MIMKRPRFVSEDDLRKQIRTMLSHESQAAVAYNLGISQPALSQFLDGSRPHASEQLLAHMGCNPMRFYQKRQ